MECLFPSGAAIESRTSVQYFSESFKFVFHLWQKLQAPLNKERQPQLFVMTKQHTFTPIGRAVFKCSWNLSMPFLLMIAHIINCFCVIKSCVCLLDLRFLLILTYIRTWGWRGLEIFAAYLVEAENQAKKIMTTLFFVFVILILWALTLLWNIRELSTPTFFNVNFCTNK